MKQLFGADIELGHSMAAYMSTVPDQWQIAKTNIDRTLQGETFLDISYTEESCRIRRCIDVIQSPLYSVAGEVTGVRLLVQDITEQNEAQELTPPE